MLPAVAWGPIKSLRRPRDPRVTDATRLIRAGATLQSGCSPFGSPSSSPGDSDPAASSARRSAGTEKKGSCDGAGPRFSFWRFCGWSASGNKEQPHMVRTTATKPQVALERKTSLSMETHSRVKGRHQRTSTGRDWDVGARAPGTGARKTGSVGRERWDSILSCPERQDRF